MNKEDENGNNTDITIQCLLCGSLRPLSKEEYGYAHHYGTIASIYICDDCRNAIIWAKKQTKMIRSLSKEETTNPIKIFSESPITIKCKFECESCHSPITTEQKYCMQCGKRIQWADTREYPVPEYELRSCSEGNLNNEDIYWK